MKKLILPTPVQAPKLRKSLIVSTRPLKFMTNKQTCTYIPTSSSGRAECGHIFGAQYDGYLYNSIVRSLENIYN